jgi:hypothetical protein
MAQSPGTRFGAYEIVSLLGRGGIGKAAVAVIIALVFAVFTDACGDHGSATTSPSPTSAPPPRTGPLPTPTGSSAVAGVVTERTPLGDRPLSGANVNAWIQTGTFGYSYMWANGPKLSDVEGRYELSNLPEGAELQLQVYKDGYVQQCAAPPLVVGGQMHMDLQLVARANVSASADTVPPSAPGLRLISGVVYELTNDGRRPAPDAFVDYELTDDSPAAITRADAAGRFLLCGISQTRTVTIGASIGFNRVAYQRVPPGPNANIEVEIK